MTAAPLSFLGQRGSRLKVAMVVLVVMPSFLLFGYNNGSTGGITELPTFVSQFPALDTVNTTGAQASHNAVILGVVTASYDLGAVCGALSCIAFGDKIGRRRSIFCGLVLSVVALAIESSAFALSQFIIGRLLVGGAIGMISASIPVWQTECSTTAHRGAFVIMEGIFISAGVSLPNWVNFGFFSAWSNSAQWRSTIVLPVVFSFFAMAFLFFMPESPRWLARKGRMNESRAVLAALMDQPTDSHEVNAEMNHIHAQLEATRGSFKLFFKGSNQRYLHRTIIAGIAQSMTQWCGCSALIFYTSTVFSGLGFTGTPVRLLSAGLVTSFTLSACIPLFTVDRVGRRVLFMVSAGGMAISMAVLAGTSGKMNMAPGFLGLPFLYAGEIATIRMRAPIVAVAVTGQWLGQFVVGQITPPGTTNLKNRYWIIYAVLNAVFVPIVYFFFPETSGRSLEEIDDIFQRSNTWNLVRNAASMPKDRDLDAADLEKKYALDSMTPDKESSIDEVENAGV
ncbi:hypothetical protein N7474_004761 [Penicillium riverlandense]|uniref:uncharacterized protein n=1 Tax=Penicillium riverlandense TaxID=1903569 RepID=UPI002549982B|nr:uncharacterized protein N7474_004761 [Penicillium riverlandense]KAJ5819170.1 hypothetical protein N7474_004761 [Penicillium riverlandense]